LFAVLNQAQDDREHREIQKAVGEWADGDSIAAHIAYENNCFCTRDAGKTADGASILDSGNRKWLEAFYGVQFISLTGLAREGQKK
jgi:hypothetical protein